jgi:hypothetical protein
MTCILHRQILIEVPKNKCPAERNTASIMRTISDSMADVIDRGELLEAAGYILDPIYRKTAM